MEVTAKLKENWKEDKNSLHESISSLKKSMTDYKIERRSEWKTFKSKFKSDMADVEKSFKRLKALHKE